MKLHLTSFLVLISFIAFSQGAYTSKDNKKSNWESTAMWTKAPATIADAPSSTDVGGSYIVNIYGYVTRNGNLTFSNGSTLVVYDTLVIRGNFTVASSVMIQSGGVLIILGDFIGTSSLSPKLTNSGSVVVTGDFSSIGGPIFANKLYSFDTTPTFGWGSSIDGISYDGNNTSAMAGHVKSKAALNSENPSLGGFVNALLGALPIKLVSFSGTVEKDVVSLNWRTAKEEGFDHFEVERASTDRIFEKIAQIDGFGYNTDDLHAYSFTDSKAVIGTNYYRLKSLDTDGSYEYSAIISAVVETTRTISLYPNPSEGYFVNVSSNFGLGENTEVMIFNQEGALLQRTQIAERDVRVDFTNQLAPGMYVVRYTSISYSETMRLIVK